MDNPYRGRPRVPVGIEYCAVYLPGTEDDLRWRTGIAPEVHELTPTTDWAAIDWYQLDVSQLLKLRANWPVDVPIMMKCRVKEPNGGFGNPSQFIRCGDFEGFLGLWKSTTPETQHSKWCNVMLLFRTYEIYFRTIKVRSMFNPVNMSEQYPFIHIVMEYMVETDGGTSRYADAAEDAVTRVRMRCHVNTPIMDIVKVFFKALHVPAHLKYLQGFSVEALNSPITQYSTHHRISQTGTMRKHLWRFLLDSDWRRMYRELQALRTHKLSEILNDPRVNMPREVHVVIAEFLGPFPLERFIWSLKRPGLTDMEFRQMSSVWIEEVLQGGVLKLLAL